MTQSMFDEYCCKKTAMAPILIAAGSCSKLIYIYISIFGIAQQESGLPPYLLEPWISLIKKELDFVCTKHYDCAMMLFGSS